MRPRYRFAITPRWILSHLLVLVLVATMMSLGLWQLRRLQERKALNRRIKERMSAPPANVSQVLPVRLPPTGIPSAQASATADRAEYRRVEADGSYRADQEVIVRARSLNGAPGSWVLTPLVQADGTAVVVNRGWIPNNGREEAVPASARAPSGPVRLVGLVQKTETRGSLGPRDPSGGRLTNLARADVGRLQQQVPEALLPAYVQLVKQSPAPGLDQPQVLAPPELSEGPHLSYAIQWFSFTAIALIGYPLILYRKAGEAPPAEGSSEPAEPAEPAESAESAESGWS